MVTSAAPYVIGLDGGTEGLRVGIFDTSGRPVVYTRAEYRTTFPHPGWAEQDPEDWWQAVVSGIRQALARSGITSDQIAAIAMGATSCSLVCLDDAGRPLAPAIIWMDVRAAEEAAEVAATGCDSLHLSGGQQASPEWLPSKALWIARHLPDVYERTAWLAEYVDYIAWRLSGEKTASLNTAGIRCYYDSAAGGWPKKLLGAIGLDDLTGKFPDTVLPMGTRIGGLSKAAQEELGLPATVGVVTGGADAFVGQIGMGTIAPGAMALVTGSSHLVLLQSDRRVHAAGLFGAYPDVTIQGQYTIEGGQASTGSMLEWYRRLIGDGKPAGEFFESMSSKAAELPPGSDGLLVLDHWQGNRTPYTDGNSRGVIAGLTLSHQKQHIFRALIESVCFGTENTIRKIREQGHKIDQVVACGGAVNSSLWLQLHADVSGIPITVNQVPEAVALGAGILGLSGAGVFSSLSQAVSSMVRASYTVEPSTRAHDAYRPFFDAYRRCYGQLADVLHFLAVQQRPPQSAGGRQ
ncbi:MAG: hypothetical protein EPN48_11030 [Microbacteriaceae bacterium]|nr:MAG: hypothetical protein EPN48_11030 [Microbacteriaceae bacterium]